MPLSSGGAPSFVSESASSSASNHLHSNNHHASTSPLDAFLALLDLLDTDNDHESNTQNNQNNRNASNSSAPLSIYNVTTLQLSQSWAALTEADRAGLIHAIAASSVTLSAGRSVATNSTFRACAVLLPILTTRLCYTVIGVLSLSDEADSIQHDVSRMERKQVQQITAHLRQELQQITHFLRQLTWQRSNTSGNSAPVAKALLADGSLQEAVWKLQEEIMKRNHANSPEEDEELLLLKSSTLTSSQQQRSKSQRHQQRQSERHRQPYHNHESTTRNTTPQHLEQYVDDSSLSTYDEQDEPLSRHAALDPGAVSEIFNHGNSSMHHKPNHTNHTHNNNSGMIVVAECLLQLLDAIAHMGGAFPNQQSNHSADGASDNDQQDQQQQMEQDWITAVFDVLIYFVTAPVGETLATFLTETPTIQDQKNANYNNTLACRQLAAGALHGFARFGNIPHTTQRRTVVPVAQAPVEENKSSLKQKQHGTNKYAPPQQQQKQRHEHLQSYIYNYHPTGGSSLSSTSLSLSEAVRRRLHQERQAKEQQQPTPKQANGKKQQQQRTRTIVADHLLRQAVIVALERGAVIAMEQEQQQQPKSSTHDNHNPRGGGILPNHQRMANATKNDPIVLTGEEGDLISADAAIRATAVQCTLGLAYLVGHEEESILTRTSTTTKTTSMAALINADHHNNNTAAYSSSSSSNCLLRDLVRVTQSAIQRVPYAGHEWGVEGMLRPMQHVLKSDTHQQVLATAGYLDLVLHVLCTLFYNRSSPNSAASMAARNVLKRLGPDLDLMVHLAAYPDVPPAYVRNPDMLRLVLELILRLAFSPQITKQLQRRFGADLNHVWDLVEECQTEQRRRVLNLLGRLRFLLDHNTHHQLVGARDDGSDNDSHVQRRDEHQHVMISYAGAQQGTAKVLAEQLRGRGFVVWLDLDQMAGDTVDAMSLAVEDARIFLLCISKDYKESHKCRLEAMYANQLKKAIIPIQMDADYRPDGWLSLMIGAKRQYDGTKPVEAVKLICEKELPSKSGDNKKRSAKKITSKEKEKDDKTNKRKGRMYAQSVLDHLDAKSSTDTHDLNKAAVTTQDVEESQCNMGCCYENGGNVVEEDWNVSDVALKDWSSSRVVHWMKQSDVGLSDYSSRFQELSINGPALVELQYIRTKDPVGFLNTIVRARDGLGITSLADALRFGHSLAKLN